MSDAQPGTVDHAREALGAYPPALLQDFETARRALEEVLSPAELGQWAADGVALAQHSLRSWEAAGEYYRASPATIEQLAFNRFREWAKTGNELLQASPALASSYYRASPAALPYLSVTQARDWAEQGRSLYKGTWKSGSLAAQYFEASPDVLPNLPLSQMRLLVELIDSLASHSYELASSCLGMTSSVLEQLDRPDRAPFLEFGAVVASTAWVDARVFFERGPGLVRQVHPQQRARFLALAGRVAVDVGRLGHPYFMEAAQALAELDRDQHRELLELSEELSPHSGIAAMEFIKSSPEVLRRLRPDDLRRWQAAGSGILADSVDGGEAFFRLESSKGEDVMDALSSRVELDRIGELIRMYCKALTGVDVGVHSAEQLTDKGVGWVDSSSPTTEGSAIYLPPVVEQYQSKDDNFAVYKVFATHQAARLEFDSFGFDYERPGGVFGRDGRDEAHEADRETPPITAMERFFDLFEDRRLAHDLFTILEDTRIDTIVKREYAGIRSAMGRLQEEAADRRKPVEEMPARQAMVENLLRASLDEASRIRWPGDLGGLMQEPLAVLEQIRDEHATVEDSAEAALRLYDWLSRVPNVVLEESDWGQIGQVQAETDDEGELVPGPGGGEGEESFMPGMPTGEEQPYESPEPVDFRGDFKPELVQMLMELRNQDMSGDSPPMPLTKEQLQELLDKNVEITINELSDGELDETSGMFLDNLMQEIQEAQQRAQQEGAPDGGDSAADDDDLPLQEVPESFYYDEWDFRANDYKPRWCRVEEMRLESGATDYYDETLAEHAALVRETRRQFEQLKPEMFRKIKRLPDGEDFDIDAVVEWMVERKAHAPTDPRVYVHRNKVERDVAVAFLLDMSASTDEEITKHQPRSAGDDQFDDDPRKYLSCFSGYGRDNVEFYVIKDMDEIFNDSVKRRIDKVAPVRSTRMGPAIRHCIYKLNETKARVKILVLLSDGRPQDHGYGRDRTEKEYAIHDTKMALTEARREGMTPFCLTVDRAGHDYLQQMCADMGYEVVSDIESLPRRLPTLYKRLTQ
jgi:hypothetical protein